MPGHKESAPGHTFRPNSFAESLVVFLLTQVIPLVACAAAGCDIPPKTLDQMLEAVAQGNLELTITQFTDLFYLLPAVLSFLKHDIDGSGSLDKGEVRRVLEDMQQMGHRTTRPQHGERQGKQHSKMLVSLCYRK